LRSLAGRRLAAAVTGRAGSGERPTDYHEREDPLFNASSIQDGRAPLKAVHLAVVGDVVAKKEQGMEDWAWGWMIEEEECREGRLGKRRQVYG